MLSSECEVISLYYSAQTGAVAPHTTMLQSHLGFSNPTRSLPGLTNDPTNEGFMTVSYQKSNNQQHKKKEYASALTLGVTSGMNQSTVQGSSKGPTKISRLSMVGSSVQISLKVSKYPNIRTSIYRISNVDDTSSIDDVMRHITSLNVRIISCFELKPSPRQKPGNKSFCVCIFVCEKNLFLNKSNLASRLLIQDWVFHPKSTEQTPPTDATSASASTNILSISSSPSRELQKGAASIAT